jgi:D-3-phosphoglycerate dehydrogenase / 2-oxoglutarate reductase
VPLSGEGGERVAQKVVILDCNFPDIDIERRVLADIDAEVTLAKCETEDEVIAAAHDADGVIVQYAPMTRRSIGGLRRLKVIARYGIGVDNIDVQAATDLGVWVANVPGFCATEVSDHTMAQVLALSRRLFVLDRSVRAGEWETVRTIESVERMTDETLGLIGFGRIARLIAPKARAFGMRVICYSPHTTPELAAEFGAERVPLAEIFAQSDYIALLCPLTPETRHVIDANSLRQMKKSAFLINVSRGALVDEVSLVAALQSGDIAGAALDVFEQEPLPMDSPLRTLPNVILSPHSAYYSRRALAELKERTARNVALVLQGQPPASPLNRPVNPRT